MKLFFLVVLGASWPAQITNCQPPTANRQHALAVRVDGEGFLRLLREGRVVYAKSAKLAVYENRLCDQRKNPLIPTVMVSGEPETISVDLKGNVAISAHGKSCNVGRIVLALFACTPSADSTGYSVSPDRPKLANPGEGEAGIIRSEGTDGQVRTTAKMAAAPALKTVAVVAETTQDFSKRAGTHIDFHALSEISNASYTLGDIADIRAPGDVAQRLRGVELGEAPALAAPLAIDRARIIAKLRSQGFAPENFIVTVPAGARIARKGQVVEREAILAKAIEAAKDQLGIAQKLAGILPGKDLLLPLGALELVAENVSTSGTGVSVVVAAFVDGQRVNSKTVRLTRAHSPISVRVGAMVKVRIKLNGATVETTARVKRTDALGETVEVETADGAILSGVPTAAGIVEVQL